MRDILDQPGAPDWYELGECAQCGHNHRREAPCRGTLMTMDETNARRKAAWILTEIADIALDLANGDNFERPHDLNQALGEIVRTMVEVKLAATGVHEEDQDFERQQQLDKVRSSLRSYLGVPAGVEVLP